MFRKDKKKKDKAMWKKKSKTSGLFLLIFYSSDLHKQIKKSEPEINRLLCLSLTFKMKNNLKIIPFLLLTNTDILILLSRY